MNGMEESAAFRTEKHLARMGRTTLRMVIDQLPARVEFRKEVQAPGAVPDLMLFRRIRGDLTYVISVEFKLKNWRRALNQAFRHRNFANEVYVALDAKHSAAAFGNLDIFAAANVGLVTVGSCGQVRILFRPKPAVPFSARCGKHVAETLLNRSCDGNRVPTFLRTIRGGAEISGLGDILSGRACDSLHTESGSVSQYP